MWVVWWSVRRLNSSVQRTIVLHARLIALASRVCPRWLCIEHSRVASLTWASDLWAGRHTVSKGSIEATGAQIHTKVTSFFCYHSIRHMAASSMKAIGVADQRVKMMGNWADMVTADKKYVDPACSDTYGCYRLGLWRPSAAVLNTRPESVSSPAKTLGPSLQLSKRRTAGRGG
eukprot:COSAG06_NODE_10472_length_1676_cov_7.212394_2_plen_174_part_00